MNTTDNDRKLKEIIKEVRLESPGPDFSSKVMKAIFTETEKKTSLSGESLLGKKFWIFVSLFILLAMIFMIFFGKETIPGSGQLQQMLSGLPKVNPEPVKNILARISGGIGTLPWTLAAVMTGASFLILADKFFSERHKISVNP